MSVTINARFPGPYSTTTYVNTTLGSGSNRALALMAYQNRTPPNINTTAPTFNGVSGHVITGFSLSNRALQLCYWLDSELPSSAGSYELTWGASAGGVSASLLECTGINQSTPVRTYYNSYTEFPTGITGSGTTQSINNLSTAHTGDLLVGCFYQSPGSATIGGSGATTVEYSSVTYALFDSVDAGAHTLDLTPVKDMSTRWWIAAALASADASSSLISVYSRGSNTILRA